MCLAILLIMFIIKDSPKNWNMLLGAIEGRMDKLSKPDILSVLD